MSETMGEMGNQVAQIETESGTPAEAGIENPNGANIENAAEVGTEAVPKPGEKNSEGLSQEAEKAFQQLSELSKDDIDTMLIAVMTEHSQTSNIMEANKIREQLGLEQKGGMEEASREREASLDKQKEKLSADIEAVEKQCLDLPEDLGEEVEETFKLKIANMVQTPDMTDEQFNLELEQSRRELTEKFVQDATEHFLKEFKSKYEDAENKDNVIKLIKAKVAKVVRKESQGFIQFGGDSDLALQGELKFVEYSTIDGEKKKYVTEFNLKKEVGIPAEQDEELGIGTEERDEIERAKESGDLTEDVAA